MSSVPSDAGIAWLIAYYGTIAVLSGLCLWTVVSVVQWLRRKATPQSGWHPDPWGQASLRWWDGEQWTAHVSAVPQPQSHDTSTPGPSEAHPTPSSGDIQ